MRVPLMGMGVAAVLVCGWVASLRYPPAQRFTIIYWLFVGFWVVMVGGSVLLRKQRQESWASTSAQILSCSRYHDGDGQSYVCSYLFEVAGRQGGSFIIWNANAGLDQLKAGLVGRTVDIRYNPEDCTESFINANSINGWRVQ